jgi:hypothetical protein
MKNLYICISSLLFSSVQAEAIPEAFGTSEWSEDLYRIAKTQQDIEIEKATQAIKESLVVKATRVLAEALYKNIPGYSRVTDKIVQTEDGRRFLYINIKADGDCGFYSLGIPRSQFVGAIVEYIEKHDENYRIFLSEREALVNLLSVFVAKENLEVINSQFESLKKKADASNLERVNKNWNEAYKNLLDNYDTLAENERLELQKTLCSVLGSVSYPGYEAFLEPLRNELISSDVDQSNLDTKNGLIDGVEKVFGKNAGRGSWLPVGLIPMVKDKYRLRYNIWWYPPDGSLKNTAKLIFSSRNNGEPVNDPKVRNIFYTGYHYDLLIPLLELD